MLEDLNLPIYSRNIDIVQHIEIQLIQWVKHSNFIKMVKELIEERCDAGKEIPPQMLNALVMNRGTCNG